MIIIDNLNNSEEFILGRIEKITSVKPVFYKQDLCKLDAVEKIFKDHNTNVVIHFAAYKSVNESIKKPINNFRNNSLSLMNVLQVMQQHKVENIIFSSSATVYGEPEQLPVTESSPFQKPLSAYISAKQMGEDILENVCAASAIKNISLRYFNPVGTSRLLHVSR